MIRFNFYNERCRFRIGHRSLLYIYNKALFSINHFPIRTWDMLVLLLFYKHFLDLYTAHPEYVSQLNIYDNLQH